MTMMRWEPFREMMGLRNAIDRLFDETFIRPSRLWSEMGAGSLPVDVYQTDGSVVVKASVPGGKPDEIDISISGDRVTIKGEHKEERETKEEEYLQKEMTYGAFNRTIVVPVPIKAEKAEAVFDDGVLKLTLPKAEEARPRQIKIKPRAAIEGGRKEEEKKKKTK